MSSTNASTSKPSQNNLGLDEQTSEQQPQQSQVSGLEEDDEFEEFGVQDWDDKQTDLEHLGGTAPGAARSGGDELWEDDWDDDDVEDEFSVRLRGELVKTGQGTTGVAPVSAGAGEAMQH
ncbi:DSS1/SEM1 family-domain-containing protein [Phellopilus nigrolimitatus]|nr:DSS1/SEM1 family-domain-containing protein [Phellopilus nigrolimitatus]KAH8118255.1 DSS1/SEM1 family-domain-containing protein [Phellopilus nigrolimitatus]